MKTAKDIKKILAKMIGVNPEDISNSDSLAEDLHMQATEISDFIQVLENENLDISRVDLTQIVTLEDLLEQMDIDYEIDSDNKNFQ